MRVDGFGAPEAPALVGADQPRDRVVAVGKHEVARVELGRLFTGAIAFDPGHTITVRQRSLGESSLTCRPQPFSLRSMATIQANASSVKQAAANPGLELLERLGYVVRGALYAVMGVLALRIAMSKPDGQAVDLTGNPFGKFVLLVIIVGLAAYSVWGLIRAVFDPLHRGSDPSGYMERLGFISSAVSYGAIAAFGLKILIGTGGASTDSTQKTISAILDHPEGGWLTVLIGLAA